MNSKQYTAFMIAALVCATTAALAGYSLVFWGLVSVVVLGKIYGTRRWSL